MLLVEAWMDRMGNVYVRPFSEIEQEKFRKVTGESCAFFQQGIGAEEFVQNDIPYLHRKNIQSGWTVCFRAQLDEIRSWYQLEEVAQ